MKNCTDQFDKDIDLLTVLTYEFLFAYIEEIESTDPVHTIIKHTAQPNNAI